MRIATTAAFSLSLVVGACHCPLEPKAPTQVMPSEKPVTATALPNRSHLPVPAPAPLWAPPEVTTWAMGNGMEVWFLRQDQAPLVSLSLVFDRGSSTDPADKAGLTALTADLLDEGAGDRSALELSEAFQRLATDYSALATQDGVVLSLNMLSDQVEPSLVLLSDVARRPALSAEEFVRRRELLVAHAVTEQADLDASLDLAVDRTLYGLGYNGTAAYGTTTTLKRIELRDVKAHYQALIKPEKSTFVVVGSIAQQTLKEALDRTFGSWSGEATASPKPLSSEATNPGIYLVDFPDSTQSSIALVKRASGADAEDYFPAAVFNWALGGAFTSRLNLNLREDKGYTYGAHSQFSRQRSAGVFGMFAQVKAETTRASLDEMYRELSKMNGAETVTEKERAEAVSAMLLGFPGRFESLSSVGYQLAHLRLTGRDANWYRGYAAELAAVTLERAVTSAKRETQGNDFVVVISGPIDMTLPTLKDMGKPIFYCDHEGNCSSERTAPDVGKKVHSP